MGVSLGLSKKLTINRGSIESGSNDVLMWSGKKCEKTLYDFVNSLGTKDPATAFALPCNAK